MSLALLGLGWLALFAAPALEAKIPELPRLALDQFDQEARAGIERALKIARERPDDAAAAGELGMRLQAYEEFAAAETCYRRASALDPDSFEWIYLLGVVQLSQGETGEAISRLREAWRRNPDYFPAAVKLGEALLEAGDPTQSEKVFLEALARRPESPLALYGLGRALAAQKKTEEAIGRFEEACSLFPGFGSAHYSLALAYRDAGRSGPARQHMGLYQENRNRWPPLGDLLLDSVRNFKTGARDHLAKGVSLAEAGRFPEAILEHGKALELDPGLFQAHVNLIRLEGELGHWERAERHYRKAVELNPNLPDAHYNFGVLLSSRGRFEEAAAAFEAALRLNPLHATAHNNLGFMLENAGKMGEALGHYREAVRNDPAYRLARFNLGRALLAEGKIGEAIEEFSKVLTPVDDQTPRYRYALAAAYVRAGELERAFEAAKQAKEEALEAGQAALSEKIELDLQRLRKALERP